jgi:hypothetical protein
MSLSPSVYTWASGWSEHPRVAAQLLNARAGPRFTAGTSHVPTCPSFTHTPFPPPSLLTLRTASRSPSMPALMAKHSCCRMTTADFDRAAFASTT